MKKLFYLAIILITPNIFAQQKLTWTSNNDNTVGFNVYQNTSVNTNFVKIGTTTAPEFDLNNLSNVVYKWRVTAFAGGLESAPSEIITWSMSTTNEIKPIKIPANLQRLPIDLLTNGDFELGQIPPFNWLANGNLIFQSNTNLASNGANYVRFNAGNTLPNGVITKMVNNLVPYARYQISFDIATDGKEQRILLEVVGKNRLVYQQFDAKTRTTGFKYSTKFWTFNPDSTNIVVKFIDISETTKDVDLFLDNIKVKFWNN